MPRPRKPWFRESTGWWMVEVGGRQVKLARGRDQRTEAELRYHELMVEVAANPPVDGGDPTVASVIDAYLGEAQCRLAGETFRERKHYLQRFAEAHGRKRVRDCIPYHLTKWLRSNPNWRSRDTLANLVKYVKACFNWAVDEGLITTNPFAKVRRTGGNRRRPMTNEEFGRLMRTAGQYRSGWKNARQSGRRFQQILVFLRFTGCRVCEVRELRWPDIDLERGVIVLTKHKSSSTQRIPRPRVIPLVPTVVKLLVHLRRQCHGSKHVFVTIRNSAYSRNAISQKLARLRPRAQVPLDAKLYGIRHFFGTSAIKAGVDLKTLAELLGHSTTRMTEHYLHIAGDVSHLAAAMRRATSSRPDA